MYHFDTRLSRLILLFVKYLVYEYITLYIENLYEVFFLIFVQKCRVPTFYSYTKCMGSPRIIHDRTLDCQPVSWACMNE